MWLPKWRRNQKRLQTLPPPMEKKNKDHNAVNFLVNTARPTKEQHSIVTSEPSTMMFLVLRLQSDSNREPPLLTLLHTSTTPCKNFSITTLQNPHATFPTDSLPPGTRLTSAVQSRSIGKPSERGDPRDLRFIVKFSRDKRLVNRHISSVKATYFNFQIIESSTRKALYSVMNNLLGSTKRSPLPTTSKQELPQVFTDKILTIWTKLDHTPFQPSYPPPSFSGTPLTAFRPVMTSEVSKTLKTMSIKF